MTTDGWRIWTRRTLPLLCGLSGAALLGTSSLCAQSLAPRSASTKHDDQPHQAERLPWYQSLQEGAAELRAELVRTTLTVGMTLIGGHAMKDAPAPAASSTMPSTTSTKTLSEPAATPATPVTPPAPPSSPPAASATNPPSTPAPTPAPTPPTPAPPEEPPPLPPDSASTPPAPPPPPIGSAEGPFDPGPTDPGGHAPEPASLLTGLVGATLTGLAYWRRARRAR